MTDRISAVILTKNSQRYLQKVLQALQSLDEVVILDNGSEDDTLQIARTFANVSIHTHPFIGFGPMKQLGASLAKNDWILSLDSDEIASSELIEELKQTPLQETCLYSYDVKNYYRGKLITCCGWDKDRFAGIYNKQYARFDSSQVHEKIIPINHQHLTVIPLAGHITHYPFENASDFLTKIKRYGLLYAKEHSGKKSSPLKAVGHASWCFIKNYFFQKGCLHGYEGFVIASYNAQSVFWKYILLYEQNTALTKTPKD